MPAKSHAKPPHDTPPAALREDGLVGTGYVWHTTGSGKTLTSFKAATLLKENDPIHKCVFVVDRRDPFLGQIFRVKENSHMALSA
ncbi:MAG: DEAD/DEAH box helicase family protein [Verrucomicrobia bacterium]|nr:DEAD/DEAH box helicase family protein [Verrucomicrobiota bacterium]